MNETRKTGNKERRVEGGKEERMGGEKKVGCNGRKGNGSKVVKKDRNGRYRWMNIQHTYTHTHMYDTCMYL